MEDQKAFDVISINIKEKSSIADFMIVASGSSSKHIISLSQSIIEVAKKNKFSDFSSEGLSKAEWVLLDLGDVIVNLFHPETRHYYNLEKMWSMNNQAETIEISNEI